MSSSDVALSTYLYCDGLKIKKISPTILEVQPGACRNNTNQNDIILNESIFLDITKSDEFGIYDGKRLPNSFYGVYVISDTSGQNPVSCMAVYKNELTLLPFGYDLARRVGWIFLDNSSNIIGFTLIGNSQNRNYYHENEISVLTSGGSTIAAPVDLSPGMPNIKTNVFLNAIMQKSDTAVRLFFLSPTLSDTGVAMTSQNYAGFNEIGKFYFPLTLVCSNETAVPALRYSVENGTVALSLSVYGFEDSL